MKTAVVFAEQTILTASQTQVSATNFHVFILNTESHITESVRVHETVGFRDQTCFSGDLGR